ncbi:MAG: DUF1573 domain-containing protein [Candidatus Zixiibacteriota bacterium]|nr:MAG: DUF1573 domain-containing protein [candidate division Zixibacteria bacterium]
MNGLTHAIAAVLLISLLAFSPALAVVGAGGTISVVGDSYDFGFVPFDYRLVHIYTITNTGPGDLHISKVVPNCDCTSAHIKDTVLSPNDSTKLKILFHTRDYYGQTRRIVAIHSDDPKDSIFEVEYSANIGMFPKAFKIDPKSLFFLPGPGAKEVNIFNYSEDRITFSLELSEDSLLTISFDSDEIKPGKSAALQVKPVEGLGLGTFYCNFTVVINATSNPGARITVPVKIVRY